MGQRNDSKQQMAIKKKRNNEMESKQYSNELVRITCPVMKIGNKSIW